LKILENFINRKNLLKIRSEIEKGTSPLVEYDRLKAIFVHIPKCAGVSVNKTIFGNLGGAIVRNPWDRLVSAFHFLKKGGMNWADKDWSEKNLAGYDNFEIFVKEWLNEDNIWKYHHFRPQYNYITLDDNKIAVDFVGYIENITEDFKIITQKIGIQADLGKENTSKRADYQSYFNPETEKIVAEVYKKDIELLGYDFMNSNNLIS